MGEQEEGELNACQTITFGPNEAYTNAASSEYLRTVYVCVFEREILWLLSVSTHQTCRPPNRSSHPALNSCLTLSVCMCLHAHSECWFVLIKSHRVLNCGVHSCLLYCIVNMSLMTSLFMSTIVFASSYIISLKNL